MELLVVIAIIGVLVARCCRPCRRRGERAQSSCSSNLRQIGVALQNHHGALGLFPRGRGTPFPYVFSVHSYILPYMEEESLKQLIDPKSPPLTFGAVSGAANALAANTRLPVYLCPSDVGEVPGSSFGPNNYVANNGSGQVMFGFIKQSDGVFFDGSKISFRQITDGSSHTAAFSESTLGDNVVSTGTTPLNARLQVSSWPAAATPPTRIAPRAWARGRRFAAPNGSTATLATRSTTITTCPTQTSGTAATRRTTTR